MEMVTYLEIEKLKEDLAQTKAELNYIAKLLIDKGVIPKPKEEGK